MYSDVSGPLRLDFFWSKMIKSNCEHVLEQRSLDEVLGLCEDRKINDYFQIYRIIQLVIGSSSSGKTTAVCNAIMSGVYEFDHLIIAAPGETIKGEGILAKFIERMEKSHAWKNKIHTINITKKGIPSFESLVEFRKKTKGKTLFLIDDWINVVTAKELEMIHRMMNNSSRLSMDMILLLQNANKVPPSIFQNATIISLFPCYIANSQFTAMMARSGAAISQKDAKELLTYCRSHDNKRLELTINKLAPYDKQIRFNNEYIVF